MCIFDCILVVYTKNERKSDDLITAGSDRLIECAYRVAWQLACRNEFSELFNKGTMNCDYETTNPLNMVVKWNTFVQGGNMSFFINLQIAINKRRKGESSDNN